MQLEATLTLEDLRSIFAQLAPLEIRLGGRGTLLLACPTIVRLIPNDGVGVVCDATLEWELLGVDIPVHLSGLAVTMQPAVEAGLEGRGPRLTFKLQVDRTGVSSLPAMFDDRVTSLLNQARCQRPSRRPRLFNSMPSPATLR
jgi:hypothetical protein